MKRFICLILALLLLCPVAYADSDLQLILTAPEGKVGETVTVTVEAKGAPVVCSYKVVIAYDDTVLKPEKIENISSLGFFMENTATEHNGKPAINALSVDASKAFEGDCKLFSATFKILKAPDQSGSPLDVVYTEFYDYDLKMLTPDIKSCSITVPSASTGDNQGEGTQPDDGNETNKDTPTGNDTPTDNDTPTGNDTQTGNSNEPSGEQKDPNDKTPTGNWYIDKDLEDVAHTNEDGTIDEYKGTFIYDDDDKLTKIELTDKDGKPAGSITVNESDSGILRVEEQDLIDTKDEGQESGSSEEEPIPNTDDEGMGKKKPLSPLVWILPVAVVLVAAGGAVAWIMIKKHKKEEE